MASIEKRTTKAGLHSWRVVWRDQGRKRSMTFDRESDARQWGALLEAARHDTAQAEASLLRMASQVPTFRDVAVAHVDRLTRATPGTVARYRRYLELHTQLLNPLPVDEVMEDDLVAWIRDRQAAGLSPKSIRNVHGLVHSVMDSAVRRGLRPDNPCNGRLLPSDSRTEDQTTFLTAEEFVLVQSFAPEWSRPFFAFLIGTGLRISEATALIREDFTLGGPVPSVRVTKAWKEDRTVKPVRWYVGPPKTRKARRTVSLPPSLASMVAPLVASTAPGDLVFRMPRGGPIRPGHIRGRAWAPAVAQAREAGLGKAPRIHDLRHSHASLMVAAGANLAELAGRLGHESITTTVGTYGHLVPDMQWRSAELAEKAIPLQLPGGDQS